MSNSNSDSLRWNRRPHVDDLPLRYPLLRVSPAGLRAIITLSGDLLGLYTHYYRGRTIPCRDRECPGCDADHAPRWHGYLWVYSPRTKAIGVLEVTAAAVLPLDKWFRLHRTLRASELTLERVPKKPNGRLFVAVAQSPYNSEDLPTPPPLRRVLLNIFGLKHLPDADQPAADVVSKSHGQVDLHHPATAT